jgi:hypothetical protein
MTLKSAKLPLLYLFTATSLSFSTASFSEKGLGRMEQDLRENLKIAIVIGINSYAPQTGMNKLDYAAPDATLLSGTLDKQGYQVIELLNENANKNNILENISQAAKRIKRQGNLGSLILTYSGHGFSHGRNNYLATFGTSSNNPVGTGLSLNTIEATINKIGVKRTMMFIDACRDQALVARSKSSNTRIGSTFVARARNRLSAKRIINNGEGVKILYAAEFGHVSWETSQLGHGIFSYFLNEGFKGRGRARDRGGIITFDSLSKYVQIEVAKWADTIKKTQLPFNGGESRGTFVIGSAIDMKTPPRHGAGNTLPDYPRPPIKPVKKPPVVLQPVVSYPPKKKKSENQKDLDAIADIFMSE